MRKKSASNFNIEDIIEEHADMVYRIALTQMKNKEDAEDIFQEVFLRLVKHLHKIKEEAHIKPWLIRVTINCCKKQFDSAWKKRVTVTEDQNIPEKIAEEIREKDSWLDICSLLPEGQREVVHLFYYERFSVKEISMILEISESSIKTRLSRARQALKGKLEGRDFDERTT